MKKIKYVCKKMLILPIWVIFILIIAAASSLAYVFVKDYEETLAAYMIYVFSFYVLMVICAGCFTTIPEYCGKVKNMIYANEYANRYFTDAVYKTQINLAMSLIINLLYVALNAASAVIYHTNWFVIFAIYYAIMALMRLLLVRYVAKNNIGESRLGELKCSRVCAYILLTVNITLSGVVLMMVYNNKGFNYRGFLIYIMAMYTFYVTIAAIADLIKYRKYNSPVMSVSKIIKFSASLFSMLFLETAMFAQFGQDTADETKKIMIMATGAGICVIVVGMSLYMIIRSSKEIREYKK